MTLFELCMSEYFVRYVNVTRNRWRDAERWSCLGIPKEHHLFLYLDGCSVLYKMKDGREIRAQSGEFMYIPAGCEYCASFYCSSNGSSTLGVNFNLFDISGAPINIEGGISVFSGEMLSSPMFEIERLSYSLSNVKMKYNTLLYSVLERISDMLMIDVDSRGFGTVRPGVEYLHKHYSENIEIKVLADMCSVSEVYFRRLFKRHTGLSPTEYRTHLRLISAAELLRFGDLPIFIISERLGFTDSSYFVKLFKEKYGVTPLAYKKKKF